MALTIPCAYQGGKHRIANRIVDIISGYIKDDSVQFYDFCCGSGAVSIELANRGFPAHNIHMIDKSPWGLFWKQIGDGTFSLDLFEAWINDIPKDVNKIQEYIKSLSSIPIYETQTDISYIFLLLQASAFGSKSIWIEDNMWKNTSFRNYWTPTETSSRRSPVNPMMPMPNTLYDRVAELTVGMDGVNGYWSDCNSINPLENSIIYIDPPYIGTTKYGFEFDYMGFIEQYKSKNIIFLSEGKQLTDIAINITDKRTKGGISGNRDKPNEEWLNIFK